MEFEEVVTTRRSVHQYDDRPLDDGTLSEIFRQARFAPSSFNLQPWEFLVVRDPENKRRLREVANDQGHVEDAAASVVVFGNLDPAAHAEAVFGDMLEKGYVPNEAAKESLVETAEGMAEMPAEERRSWTDRSTALAAMALMHAAWAEGVASCPVGGFDADALVEEFDVPAGYEPVVIVTLGYPAEDADALEKERKYRRPVEEVVHHETFDPAGADTPGGDAASADD